MALRDALMDGVSTGREVEAATVEDEFAEEEIFSTSLDRVVEDAVADLLEEGSELNRDGEVRVFCVGCGRSLSESNCSC